MIRILPAGLAAALLAWSIAAFAEAPQREPYGIALEGQMIYREPVAHEISEITEPTLFIMVPDDQHPNSKRSWCLAFSAASTHVMSRKAVRENVHAAFRS